MAQDVAKIRLCVAGDLAAGAGVALAPGQAHYLTTVMRLGEGAPVLAFNGRDGEWLCHLAPDGRRAASLAVAQQTRPQTAAPDLWLLFAPIKKARTDFVVEKAVELGAARILPVFTRLTNSERVNVDRLQAHAVEAAEQCGRLDVAQMAAPMALDRLLADWPAARRLLFCDESGAGQPIAAVLAAGQPGPWAVLIGPEGGFDAAEAARLRGHPCAVAVGLGPRILRADTAAVAALAIFQAALGDWR